MAFDKSSLDSYIQVNERILRFIEKYPDGSLQSELVKLAPDLVVMKGFAYRTPDDARPGIGYSSLQIPGPTPYTKHSEIENAETSAWGRALAALGFEVKRGVASRDEIENKHDDDPFADAPPKPKLAPVAPKEPLASAEQSRALWQMVKRSKGDKAESWLKNRFAEMKATRATLTVAQIKELTSMLQQPEDESQEPQTDDTLASFEAAQEAPNG